MPTLMNIRGLHTVIQKKDKIKAFEFQMKKNFET